MHIYLSYITGNYRLPVLLNTFGCPAQETKTITNGHVLPSSALYEVPSFVQKSENLSH